MRCFLAFWLFLTIALVVSAWLWAVYGAPWMLSSTSECIDLYQRNARTPIFSGFITMGSFLLALKTNILGRLKDTYDTDEYKLIYRARLEGTKNSQFRFYETLERLSRSLGWNIYFCLFTALCQMTLGFLFKPWAFAVCAGLAASCLLFLLTLTYYLLSAHKEWFDTIESQMQEKLKDLEAKNRQ